MDKQFVLVATEYRTVYAGFLERHDDNRSVVLSCAKCAISWNTTKGLQELAKDGPNEGSRIGAEAERITLYGVTSLSFVSDEAREKWLAA